MATPDTHLDRIAVAMQGRRPRTLDDPTATSLFAGENAATANKEALALAKEMAAKGMSRDQIWHETHRRHGQGWFYHPQAKQWNYETAGGPPEMGDIGSMPATTQSIGSYFKDAPTDTAYPGIEHSSVSWSDDPEAEKADWIAHVTWPEKRRTYGAMTINPYESDRVDELTLLHERQHQIRAFEGASKQDVLNDQRVPWAKRWMEREAENAAARHYFLTPTDRARMPPWQTETDAMDWGRTGWDDSKRPKSFPRYHQQASE